MNRKILGLVTLWPLIYVLFFFVVVGVATAQGGGDPDNAELLIPFEGLVALHIGTILLTIALLLVYVRDAYSNPQIDDDKRAFWAVVLLTGSMIAMPIYWWLYMRPDRGADAAA